MRTFSIILVLAAGIGFTSCNRDDRYRDGPTAREAGREAYRASQAAKKDAKEAERELRNAGKDFRDGWNEAKQRDAARNR